MSNVWVLRLTCVFRMIETVCSVFMSVSVIHCNVCAYVALHFQWLPCLDIMKSVCDSRDCENMSVYCYNKCNIYCILPCGVEH